MWKNTKEILEHSDQESSASDDVELLHVFDDTHEDFTEKELGSMFHNLSVPAAHTKPPEITSKLTETSPSSHIIRPLTKRSFDDPSNTSVRRQKRRIQDNKLDSGENGVPFDFSQPPQSHNNELKKE